MSATARLEAVPAVPKTRAQEAREHLAKAQELASQSVNELEETIERVGQIALDISREKQLYPAGLVEACRKLNEVMKSELDRVQQMRAK